MTPEALRRLAGLMEARKVRDLARLDGLMSEDRRLQAEIAELAATGRRDADSPTGLPLSHQERRVRWSDQRIALAKSRRIGLAAEIAAARGAAVQSLGRDRALDRLAERSERAANQAREARFERQTPPPVAPKPR
jgi:hypothetical protein